MVTAETGIKLERADRSGGKTKIGGAPDKKRPFVAKFLNFKDKQEVLSEHKASFFLTKLLVWSKSAKFFSSFYLIIRNESNKK